MPATRKEQLLDDLGEQALKLLADLELESLTMRLADIVEWMRTEMISTAASSSGVLVRSRECNRLRAEAKHDDNETDDVNEIAVAKRPRFTKFAW